MGLAKTTRTAALTLTVFLPNASDARAARTNSRVCALPSMPPEMLSTCPTSATIESALCKERHSSGKPMILSLIKKTTLAPSSEKV